MSKCINRKRMGIVLGFILVFLTCVSSDGNRLFYVTFSSSLPRGIYMSIPGNISTGDYVAYDIPLNVKQYIEEHKWEGIPDKFIKKVGATAGMEYRIDDNGFFYIEDRYIGSIVEKDESGLKLEAKVGNHKVPTGEFLPLGTNGRSFDGRYTGTVPLSAVRSRVIPFITE